MTSLLTTAAPVVPNSVHTVSSTEFLADDYNYDWFWPVFAVNVAACELLWRLAPRKPFVVELQRRTGLNSRVLQSLAQVQDEKSLQALWRTALPTYYYTLLIGRLILESPLRELFEQVATSDTLTTTELRQTIEISTAYVRETTPVIEYWFIGIYDDSSAAAAAWAINEEQQSILAAWKTRRSLLEEHFVVGAPTLLEVVDHFFDSLEALEKMAPPAAATPFRLPKPAPKSARKVVRTGTVLEVVFQRKELATLQHLFGVVATILLMNPRHDLPKALAKLYELHPPHPLAALWRRLIEQGVFHPIRLSLIETVTLLQVLQAAYFFVERAGSDITPSRWIQTLASYGMEPHPADVALRDECLRIYQLLQDDDTRSDLLADIKALLKRVNAVSKQAFPHSPAIAFAQRIFEKLRKYKG
jgi:hypothetical protein